MCRLFGFRSLTPSQVHSSLISADNALLHLSNFHPDGWGVAYYVAHSPHVVKSTAAAMDDHLFRKVSGVVSSETLVAHIRKSTQGDLCITNTHPFQHGRWIFAHNGNIANFKEHRQELVEQVAPILRRYILGDTDSEVLFFILLSNIARRVDLHRKGPRIEEMMDAVRETVDKVVEIVGPYHLIDSGPPTETYLTFILTDGYSMVAHQGGKALHYSTFKGLCPERDICPSYSVECESPTTTGYVNYLVLSSEQIKDANTWQDMSPGQIIGVDPHMHFRSHTKEVLSV